MNIVVCIKQIPDTETQIKLLSGGSNVDTSRVRWIMNPYDEIAVEQALLIREKLPGSKVWVIRLGAVHDSEILRTAVALGADEGILIKATDREDSFSTAKALRNCISRIETPIDLVLMGKQAIDDSCHQVHSILGQMMGCPSINDVNKFVLAGDGLELTREGGGGSVQTYQVQTPVVVSCTRGLNVPRFPTLPNIMKAKKRVFAEHTLAELDVTPNDTRVKYHSFSLPVPRPAGRKFDLPQENGHETSGIVE